jgi:hypothetical protein
MPTPPQHLVDLARRAHVAGAPAHVLRGHVVDHVQREAAREEAVEHAMALVDALYETPGAPKVRLWTGLASGDAPRVYFPVGYVTVGADGSIGGASIQPGRRRQALTFSESSLYPSQRRAYKKAFDLYRAGLLERAEEQAMARAEQIEELVEALEALDAAVAGEEDDEHIERQAERAAWQARHEEGRGNPIPRLRRNALPPGFTSKFSFFPEADDYTPPPLTETRRVFRDVKRGDVVTVGKTRWVIMRPVGDVQAYAYKHPSKRTKLYEVRVDGEDEVVVFEIGGSAQRISDDLVRGPLRATRETVDL